MDSALLGRGTRRRTRWLSVIVLALLPLVLTSCAPKSSSYAQEACKLVNKSLYTYRLSEQRQGPVAAQDRISALALLRQALPLAALAASTNGAWQALQATLSETNRVPEAHLVSALSQQCSTSSNNININIPSSGQS